MTAPRAAEESWVRGHRRSRSPGAGSRAAPRAPAAAAAAAVAAAAPAAAVLGARSLVPDHSLLPSPGLPTHDEPSETRHCSLLCSTSLLAMKRRVREGTGRPASFP